MVVEVRTRGDGAWTSGLGSIGYRVTRAGQMTTRYSWLYKRSGPFSWRPRPAAERDAS